MNFPLAGFPPHRRVRARPVVIDADYFLSLAADPSCEIACRVEDGHITESGGLISQVDDRSGNARHATQESALLQPELDTATLTQWSVMLNGGSVLDVADTLANAMPQTGWTFAVVFQADATAGNQGIWCISAGAGGYSLTIEGTNWAVRHQPSGVTSDGAADTDLHLIIIGRIGTTDHMIIDGIEVALGATPTAPTPPTAVSAWGMLLKAGLVFPFAGWSCEIIALSRDLTGLAPGAGNACTGECALYTEYFMNRYL